MRRCVYALVSGTFGDLAGANSRSVLLGSGGIGGGSGFFY